MADQNRHVAIHIPPKLLHNKLHFSKSECCIYKVPSKLRNLNPDAYTPKVVSIGPFHHENAQLQEIQGEKYTCYRKFLGRSEASEEELIKCVDMLEPKIRRSYSKKIKLNVKKFIELILVDCCFVLELLGNHDQPTKNDTSIRSWELVDVLSDLMLIENQLPFFVFEKIYNLAFASRLRNGEHESFWKLATSLFLKIEGEKVELQRPAEDSIAHFTDLYRYCRLHLSKKLPQRGQESLGHLHNVTELKEAGVKFKVNEESKHFLDLKFSAPYLKIPQFKVTDRTEMILRNMVIFEQCYYPKEPYFTDYVVLLDCLINTEKDVDILVKEEIIDNGLGDSNAVAKMFNGLRTNVEIRHSNTKYLLICRKLKDYYKAPWHRRVENLKRNYFNTPWMTAASITAIVLVILTIIQTICSIIQVV